MVFASIPVSLIVGVIFLALIFAAMLYGLSQSSILMTEDNESWSDPLLFALFGTFCLLTLSFFNIEVSAGPPRIFLNLTGAIVPVAVCIYLLLRRKVWLVPALVVTAVVALVGALLVQVRDNSMVIDWPLFLVPAFIAAGLAFILAEKRGMYGMIYLAYFSATIGMLIGGDIFKVMTVLPPDGDVTLGAEGVMDFVFLSGVVAVALLLIGDYLAEKVRAFRAGGWRSAKF